MRIVVLLRTAPYSLGLFFVVGPLLAFRRNLWPRSLDDVLLYAGLLLSLLACEVICNIATQRWDEREQRGPRDGRHAVVTLLVLGSLMIAFYRYAYGFGK